MILIQIGRAGNHSGGTDLFSFKVSYVHGTMVMCTLRARQEIALLVAKTNGLCRELRKRGIDQKYHAFADQNLQELRRFLFKNVISIEG